MSHDGDEAGKIKEILERIEEEYGRIPLVSQMLSERPDLFVPYSEMSKNLFFTPKHLDQATAELAAIAAGAALGSEYCLDVHIEQAFKYGATREQIFEAMVVGSIMCMNKSNSVSFRRLVQVSKDMESRK